MSARLPQRIPPGMALSLLQLLAQRANALESHDRRHTSQRGLSLIECLIAIIIIALTVVAILPPIMLATASRIQSRRAEQANQIAQGEVDRIRTIVERGSYLLNQLPAAGSSQNIKDVGPATQAPSGSTPMISPGTSCPNRYPAGDPATPSSIPAPVPVDSLIRVDVDGDCQPEYVMQVFRTTGRIPTGARDSLNNPIPYSFDMGVRVYTYFPNQPFPQLETTRASLIVGTGPRDVIDGTRRRPLAALYTTIARNDSSRSLGQLCVEAGGTCSY